MKLIRRFSLPLTLLTLAAAAVAAPYLTPGDPDGAVFRSGVLALLLLAACFSPVRRAYDAQPLRALVCGEILAFLFALALGVGSELTFYGRMLPGMGSLVRRMAVPVMITPLFGTLLSFLFSYEPAAPKARREIPYAVFFLLFLLCYGAVMLAFYPGVICYDFEHEIRQFQSGVYEAAHPVFHTLFLGVLYALGEAVFGSMTAGAACYSAAQLTLLAAMYARACTFAQRRLPRMVTLLLAACFAFLPFHGVLAVSTAKDPLFAGLVVLLCLQLYAIAEDDAAFLADRRRPLRFVLTCVLLGLLRRNGVFAFLPAVIAALILLRRHLRRALPVMAAALVLSIALPKALDAAVGAQSAPSSEMMSVPCQQLMRTAATAELSEEEYAEISAWFSDAIHRYRPYCADPAKGGNFDFARYRQNPGDYWALYARHARRFPRIYAEAFLLNCSGLWHPDDVSHATALFGESYDHVYLITEYMYEDGRYDLHPASKLPRLKTLIYDYTHHNAAQETPVLAQLFCPATYTYLMLFAVLLCAYRRRGRMALTLLPLWGIWGSLLFSAGIFVRYAYPIMAAAPVLAALIVFSPRKNA